jgi:hypothetical protein
MLKVLSGGPEVELVDDTTGGPVELAHHHPASSESNGNLAVTLISSHLDTEFPMNFFNDGVAAYEALLSFPLPKWKLSGFGSAELRSQDK